MAFDNDDVFRERSRLEVAGGSALRVVLLFGSVAVAIALITSQVLDSRIGGRVAQNDVPGLDYTATGSIGYNGTYTVRRTVLQPPGAVCILRDNGTRSGSC